MLAVLQIFPMDQSLFGLRTRPAHLARRYGQAMLLTVALVAGGLAMGATAQPAAAAEANCRVVTTNGSPLNIRSRADSNASIVGTIAKGRTLDVIGGPQNGWVQVRATVPTANGSRTVEGWVASSFLRPCAVATPPRTCRMVATSDRPLNIRSRADDDAPILGTIAKGRTLEVTGSARNGWVPVRATVITGNGSRTVEGWAAAAFLRPCTTAQNPQNPIKPELCRRVVYGEGLSVHANPDLTSPRRGGVAAGSEVQLLNRESTTAGGAVWMQINQPVQGWIPVRSLNRPTDQLNVLNCL